MDKVVEYGDLEKSRAEILNLGEPGRVFYELVRREGRAIWIPDFVNWLFKSYELKPYATPKI